MAVSNWRIGDFYFPIGYEPKFFKPKQSTGAPIKTLTMPHTPWNFYAASGRGMTQLSIQGEIYGFTGGTATNPRLDDLTGACAFDGTEKVIQTVAHDGTVRRYYGIPDMDYTEVARQKNLYAYNINITCPDPFSYDTTLSSVAYTAVGTSDTTISLGSSPRGTADSYPVILVENTSGGTLSDYSLIITDGSTTSTGNYIQTSAHDLTNNTTRIIRPYLWNDEEWKTDLFGVWDYSGAIAVTSDTRETISFGDLTQSGNYKTTYPRISDGITQLKAKASVGGATVGIQWRKAYS